MYYRVHGERNGKELILIEDYTGNKLEVKKVSDRLLWVHLVNEGEVLNMVSLMRHRSDARWRRDCLSAQMSIDTLVMEPEEMKWQWEDMG